MQPRLRSAVNTSYHTRHVRKRKVRSARLLKRSLHFPDRVVYNCCPRCAHLSVSVGLLKSLLHLLDRDFEHAFAPPTVPSGIARLCIVLRAGGFESGRWGWVGGWVHVWVGDELAKEQAREGAIRLQDILSGIGRFLTNSKVHVCLLTVLMEGG